MRHTKNVRYMQAGWAILLTALMLSLLVTPVSAASNTTGHAARRIDTATYVGAKIYLATSSCHRSSRAVSSSKRPRRSKALSTI